MSSGGKGRPAYPTGPTLNAMEKRIGYPHRPLGRDGEVLRYNYSANSGCVQGNCSFSHQSRTKPEGIHCTSTYELARRGGLTTSKRIGPQAVGRYLQALREKNTLKIRRSVEASRNATGRSRATERKVCVESRWAMWKNIPRMSEEGIKRSLWWAIPRG